MEVRLPDEIDYSAYDSNSGMATRIWGSRLWGSLFTSIMGRYPFVVDYNSTTDLNIVNTFSQMLVGLKDTLPCVFCRKSFETFVKELPIEPYLKGRIELMYWLYLMKDKVNKKLICQEKICYNDAKARLKGLFHHGDITEADYYNKISDFKKATFVTVPSPTFKEVLDEYESMRAVCSKMSLSCILATKD